MTSIKNNKLTIEDKIKLTSDHYNAEYSDKNMPQFYDYLRDFDNCGNHDNNIRKFSSQIYDCEQIYQEIKNNINSSIIKYICYINNHPTLLLTFPKENNNFILSIYKSNKKYKIMMYLYFPIKKYIQNEYTKTYNLSELITFIIAIDSINFVQPISEINLLNNMQQITNCGINNKKYCVDNLITIDSCLYSSTYLHCAEWVFDYLYDKKNLLKTTVNLFDILIAKYNSKTQNFKNNIVEC